MYKSRVYRSGSDTSPRDSGSESTPILSSESRTSLELSAISDDLETSDSNLSPAGCSLKYGSIDAASYSTTLTAVPKRPTPLTRNNELYLSAAAHSPCIVNFVHEKNHEARNIDLVLTNENTDKKAYGIDFPSGSQFQSDMMDISCKDLKPKQSSLVTIWLMAMDPQLASAHLGN